jgi:hypothetical protein
MSHLEVGGMNMRSIREPGALIQAIEFYERSNNPQGLTITDDEVHGTQHHIHFSDYSDEQGQRRFRYILRGPQDEHISNGEGFTSVIEACRQAGWEMKNRGLSTDFAEVIIRELSSSK